MEQTKVASKLSPAPLFRGRVVFPLIAICVCVLLLVFPGTTGAERLRSEWLGPTAFPSFTLYLMITLFAAIALQEWREASPRQRADAPSSHDGEFNVLSFIGAAGGMCIFALALPVIGFLPATFLFLLILLFGLFHTSSVAAIATSAGLTAFAIVLFGHVLTVGLPRGVQPFYQFNYLVY